MSLLRSGTTGRSAVTLIELLVVLGIIGILVGLIMPAVQQVRGAAARLSCQNRLRQVALGLHGHHDTHGAFPRENSSYYKVNDGSLGGLSWRVKSLPFIDSQAVYDAAARAYTEDNFLWHNPPHVGLATVVPVYTCPADSRLATPQPGPDGILATFSSYVGVAGSGSQAPDGVLSYVAYGAAVRLADITDGSSQTVMVGERPPRGRLDSGWWYCEHQWFNDGGLLVAGLYAWDSTLYAEMSSSFECRAPQPPGKFVFGPGRITNPCDMYHFWSLDPGGANFAFADGSVRFLSYSASRILPALASRDGGEVVEFP